MVEDKSNQQSTQVRLPLRAEHKAVIIIAISKHRPKECPLHYPRSRAVWKICQLTKAEVIALPRFLFLQLMAGKRSHIITPG